MVIHLHSMDNADGMDRAFIGAISITKDMV